MLDAYGPGITQRLLDSPYLTRLPASMDPSPYAVTHRYHEPLRPGVLPDWWGGAEEPLVNVTLGTEAGALPTAVGLYRAVVDAVSALPVRVLLTTGHHIDASDLGPLPPHVHVEPWVPQADVLRGASLVVCHGGSGTVYGALAAGVPLVCVPLFADQPENADLVTGAGAGMAVPDRRPGERAGAPGPRRRTEHPRRRRTDPRRAVVPRAGGATGRRDGSRRPGRGTARHHPALTTAGRRPHVRTVGVAAPAHCHGVRAGMGREWPEYPHP